MSKFAEQPQIVEDSGLQHISHDTSYPQAVIRNEKEVHLPPTLGTKVDSALVQQDLPQEKRMCGLTKRWLFILIVAAIVIVAIVVGATVGTLTNRSKPINQVLPPSTTNSSVSSGPTSTLSAVTSQRSGANDCPGSNGTSYSSPLYPSQNYRRLCRIDYPVGFAGLNGKSTVKDLSNIIFTSMPDCINQCSADRTARRSNCTAVVYGADIQRALNRSGITGNCFLKDQRALNPYTGGDDQIEAAYLI